VLVRHNCGLPLQKRFRIVRHVQKGEKESFARLEVERDGTHVGFYLGPSLIDGSFQAAMALADTDVGTGTLKIPQSIRRLYCIGVWSYLQLIGIMDQSMAFRSWLLDDVSEALLYFDHVRAALELQRAATPNRNFVLKNFKVRQTPRNEEVDALKQATAILSRTKFEEFLQQA
jgi:hypothetical protein